MKRIKKLPIPEFYSPTNATLPDYGVGDVMGLQQKAIEWRKQHELKNVGSDTLIVSLLGIDVQGSFCFPSGTLFVAGAMDDNDRLSQLIYKYLGVLSQIICTMDTHLIYQIFHPIAHLDENDNHPTPATMISAEDYRRGKYRANPAMAVQIGVDLPWLQRQFTYYCEQLEATGKYGLTIWPYHCLLGSPGHQLVGVIEEARLFHSFARGAANIPEIKGGNPLTEHYSILKPEVMTCWDSQPIPGAQKNIKLIETLLKSDVVIIAGQAKSHCLAWTIDDLLNEILAKDPEIAQKVYLLEDCTSPVVIPGVIDFTDQANEAFQRFADAGMNVVRSTTPMEEWPGIEAKLATI